MTFVLSLLACLAAIPVGMGAVNLLAYRRLPTPPRARLPAVTVAIPARNEARRLSATLEALTLQRGVSFEVLVLDDASEDGTADLVREYARRDPRVRLLRGQGPPPGWNGKQYACHVLAGGANQDWILFMDADVVLEPGSLARLLSAHERADLTSAFPRLLTISFLERLLIPLIPFLLLGFLPIPIMRRTRDPRFAAGCGQCFLTSRRAYQISGGHAAIRSSRHDGLTLPRAYRRAGLTTDIVDGTDLASTRMYTSAREVWEGLSKNAHEGLAGPRAIYVWTMLLGVGQCVPWIWAVVAAGFGQVGVALISVAIGVSGTGLRALLAWRLRSDVLSVALHPIGVAVLLVIQWSSAWRRRRGGVVSWKGRSD